MRFPTFKRNKTAELIIKPRYSSRTKVLIAGVLATAALALVAFVYNYGLSMAGFERWAATRAQESLTQDIKRLETENQELREALARAQRSVQMGETAHQELDKSLQNSAQEIVRLRGELNFYRNIISPTDKKPGLRIQNLVIESDGRANQYRYKLVLVQALKHERTIYGTASIEVRGMQAGADSVHKLIGPGGKAIQVNFKYFQDIEGRFELPRSFRPQQIRVSVYPTSGPPVEGTYNWPSS
jgi:hypothetical protein